MPQSPADEPSVAGLEPADQTIPKHHMVLATAEFTTLLRGSPREIVDVYLQMPLPGIVIFVHGVNSDGEWFKSAEEGLCKGLNERLRRRNEDLVAAGPEVGQLAPVKYAEDLTADGFVNPEKTFKNFIEPAKHFSPVIHFRWGYKANSQELQQYGGNIYLNEHDYWGGGPFANGCSSLPDLWGLGLSDQLLPGVDVQDVNPVKDRLVYACPPRPYFVVAALRLARLVQAIRRRQANVPITIVCHSQGNMIGMAAAFLGDRLPVVNDPTGVAGRCVADSYILCNPPYSLVPSNFSEHWTQSHMRDKQGRSGRQTGEARVQTLRAFFDIMRKPAAPPQDPAEVDRWMANTRCDFTVDKDRMRYGFGAPPSTLRRVTLYCNPHDQVISASAIQGIGWRGMNDKEIEAAGGAGVFSQRVFAQGFEVGKQQNYDFWKDHWRQLDKARGSQDYWWPHSPVAKPVVLGIRVNALPPDKWTIPLHAPALPPFMPRSLRFDAVSDEFDEGYDVRGQQRSKGRPAAEGDPYAGDRAIPQKPGGPKRPATDAAQGDVQSEAALRYEDHALMRMKARREGRVAKGAKVEQEDKPETATQEHKEWRARQIKASLEDGVDTHATDHSTILTNPMHAEKALAYDVGIGCCEIPYGEFHKLRILADWRFVKGLGEDDPNLHLLEYFESGLFKGVSPHEWVNAKGSEGAMPDAIADQRQNQAPTTHGDREYP